MIEQWLFNIQEQYSTIHTETVINANNLWAPIVKLVRNINIES